VSAAPLFKPNTRGCRHRGRRHVRHPCVQRRRPVVGRDGSGRDQATHDRRLVCGVRPLCELRHLDDWHSPCPGRILTGSGSGPAGTGAPAETRYGSPALGGCGGTSIADPEGFPEEGSDA
jgi:hypothetical protein